MNIKNSVVLVTGASKGLGRAIVEELLECEATKIYATDRDEDSLMLLRALDPHRITPIVMDITNTDAIEAVARVAGDVTLLINNAGSVNSYGVLSSTRKKMQDDMDVNYFGTLNVIRLFAGVLEKNHGTVVNIISIAALASVPGLGGYSASKAALHSLTQSVRGELRSGGVSVHGVFPGLIDTDMTHGFNMPKTSAKEVAEGILMGIEHGDEDIFPDQMSKVLSQLRTKDPKDFERQLGALE